MSHLQFPSRHLKIKVPNLQIAAKFYFHLSTGDFSNRQWTTVWISWILKSSFSINLTWTQSLSNWVLYLSLVTRNYTHWNGGIQLWTMRRIYGCRICYLTEGKYVCWRWGPSPHWRSCRSVAGCWRCPACWPLLPSAAHLRRWPTAQLQWGPAGISLNCLINPVKTLHTSLSFLSNIEELDRFQNRFLKICV